MILWFQMHYLGMCSSSIVFMRSGLHPCTVVPINEQNILMVQVIFIRGTHVQAGSPHLESVVAYRGDASSTEHQTVIETVYTLIGNEAKVLTHCMQDIA